MVGAQYAGCCILLQPCRCLCCLPLRTLRTLTWYACCATVPRNHNNPTASIRPRMQALPQVRSFLMVSSIARPAGSGLQCSYVAANQVNAAHEAW
jgi:hypothetical protein